MISILVPEGNGQETDFLITKVKDIAARAGDERLELLRIRGKEEWNICTAQREKLDAAIVDVTAEDGVVMAKFLRKKYPEIEILIISDTTVSPIAYLNPEVRAASLLLKPLQKEAMESTIAEFLALFDKEEACGCLFVEQKGEKRRLPFQKIRYLEAREKKVYARMLNVEYALYDTIDHLAEILPKEFIRCHRSYIVNYIFIESIRYSENYILLSGNQCVPLSRSYKPVLKEVMSHA